MKIIEVACLNFCGQKYKMHKSRTLTKNGYSMSKNTYISLL